MHAVAGQTRYTGVAIALHWVIAVAIAGQIASGVWMVEVDPQDPFVFTVYQAHKSLGLAVLVLTMARLVWRLGHSPPPLPPEMSTVERLVAGASHHAFYGLMLAVPLSGWAMVSVSPTGVPTFFAMFESLPFAHLPLAEDADLAARKDWEAMARNIHGWLAYGTVGLLVLHVAAALKHQLVARDGLITRMVPGSHRPTAVSRPGFAIAGFGLAGLFLAGGLVGGQISTGSAPSTRDASDEPAASAGPASSRGEAVWTVDPEVSSLGFTISFGGNQVAGRFSSWSATIAFQPARLEGASAVVVIDMTSVTLDDAYLSNQAGGADGFDTATHEMARFEASVFRGVEGNRYEADGTLTLRGVSTPVMVSFTFDETEGVARVMGLATLNRLDFGIGSFSAPDESWLKNAVEVVFEIEAAQQP